MTPETRAELEAIRKRQGDGYAEASRCDVHKAALLTLKDVRRCLSIIEEQERDRARALAVLDLSSHYDSLEDACRQRMQAYITECDNAETARRDAFDEAMAALVSAQEQVVLVGKQGRSARNAEMRRRQAIYIRGWDDARAALVAARDTESKEAQS